MCKFINIINSNDNGELSELEAKHLELTLNYIGLVALDGGHALSFAADVEEKSWGTSYGVLVKDTVTAEVIGRLESPMAIRLEEGVYALQDGSSKGIRVVCFNADHRKEIEK